MRDDSFAFPFVVFFAFAAMLAVGVTVASCSADLDAQRAEVRAALRAAGYTPLEIPRSYRDEAGVREIRARVERAGVVRDVVVFRDGSGPWRIAAEEAKR